MMEFFRSDDILKQFGDRDQDFLLAQCQSEKKKKKKKKKGFLGGSGSKESGYNAGDPGLISGLG